MNDELQQRPLYFMLLDGEPVLLEGPERPQRTVPRHPAPAMSDFKWQLLCFRSRIDYPENYMDEDVESTLFQLARWLYSHKEQGAGVLTARDWMNIMSFLTMEVTA